MSDVMAFLRWWALMLVIGWLAWPVAGCFLHRIPDRGYSVSKAFGLLLGGYIFWILSGFGYLRLDTGGVLMAFAIMGIAGVFLNHSSTRSLSRIPLMQWARQNWRIVIVTEGLFLLSFAIFAYIRALNPEINATEKPMEFAFLNSILRSDGMPPRDPWLSGYAISYYYFGYVIIAMLTVISGVLPSVAFNLGIALLFALAAIGSFGVVLNLISIVAREEHRQSPERYCLSRFAFPALMAPVFTIVVGNLNGILEVFHQRGIGPSSFWAWLGIKWLNAAPDPSGTWMPQRYLWWWQSSRVIRDVDLSGTPIGLQPIDEFPFFSFLLGDMHPHVLALPFVFVALVVSLQVLLEGRCYKDPPISGIKRILAVLHPLPFKNLCFYAVVLGGLSFLNTWDFPIYLAITVAAYLTGAHSRSNPDRNVWLSALALAICLATLGLLLYMPFYLTFRSQANGLLPNLIFVTRPGQFMVMFGPILIPVLGWLVWHAIRYRHALDWRIGIVTGPGILLLLASVCAGLSVLMLSDPLFQGHAVESVLGQVPLQRASSLILRRRLLEFPWTNVLLTMVLLVTGALLPSTLRSDTNAIKSTGSGKNRATAFVLILVGCGALLTLGPDFVYLRDSFGARLNTVFKLYFQAWVLWSLAGAFGVWHVFGRASLRVRLTFGVCVLSVLAAGLVYPTLSLWTKTMGFRGTTQIARGRIATLDGTAYMSSSRLDDYLAIGWINQSLDSDAVISEAIGGSYTEYGRVSAHTGLATVLGWPGHELQWRGGYSEAAGREEDIATLYSSHLWSEALDILAKYDIRYVYLGHLERVNFPASGVTKFEENMQIVYSEGDVTIYER